MSRLLEALKRLEPELPAMQSSASAALAECSTDAESGANASAETDSLAVWFEDESDESAGDAAADFVVQEECTSEPVAEESFGDSPEAVVAVDDEEIVAQEECGGEVASADLSEDHPAAEFGIFVNESADGDASAFAEIATEFDNLSHLLNEELPSPDLRVRAAEIEPAEQPSIVPFHVPSIAEEKAPADELPEVKKSSQIYDGMARNILAQLPGERSVVLFFTSPTDGEGKTELILPLAQSLIAASGRRTILVDANLHRPDLTNEWQFTSRKGIFDVLSEEADWWEAVQETGLPKLSILLNNGLPHQDAVVAQPLAFSRLLNNLKGEYRLVMVDAASLAHDESISMLRHCQGVYLVVRLGHASRRTVREAKQVITQAGGKLYGCIAVGGTCEPAA